MRVNISSPLRRAMISSRVQFQFFTLSFASYFIDVSFIRNYITILRSFNNIPIPTNTNWLGKIISRDNTRIKFYFHRTITVSNLFRNLINYHTTLCGDRRIYIYIYTSSHSIYHTRPTSNVSTTRSDISSLFLRTSLRYYKRK